MEKLHLIYWSEMTLETLASLAFRCYEHEVKGHNVLVKNEISAPPFRHISWLSCISVEEASVHHMLTLTTNLSLLFLQVNYSRNKPGHLTPHLIKKDDVTRHITVPTSIYIHVPAATKAQTNQENSEKKQFSCSQTATGNPTQPLLPCSNHHKITFGLVDSLIWSSVWYETFTDLFRFWPVQVCVQQACTENWVQAGRQKSSFIESRGDSYFDIVKLHAAPSSAPGHVLILTLHPHRHVHACDPLPSCAHPAGLRWWW